MHCFILPHAPGPLRLLSQNPAIGLNFIQNLSSILYYALFGKIWEHVIFNQLNRVLNERTARKKPLTHPF